MTALISIFSARTKAGKSGGNVMERAASAVPPSSDVLGRYRYLVKAASAETIERATAEMFAALDSVETERIYERIDHHPEFACSEVMHSSEARVAHVAYVVGQAEWRRPGALERAGRAGLPGPMSERLCETIAAALVSTPSARAFFSRSEPGPEEMEDDPDFSEEFGYERGYAGGSGFENVEFERWT